MIDAEVNNQLTNDIKKHFNYFDREVKINGMPFIQSKQLSIKEVARIAFSIDTPTSIAKNFFDTLLRANKLINGKCNAIKDINGNPMKFPKHRILLVLYKTGLKIWID